MVRVAARPCPSIGQRVFAATPDGIPILFGKATKDSAKGLFFF